MKHEPLRDFDRASWPDVTSITDVEDARAALRRIFKRLARIFALVRQRDPDAKLVRAGGGVVCEMCGALYIDHANDPIEPWMTMLCDGRRVKL